MLKFLEAFKTARDASADIQTATTLALEHRVSTRRYSPSCTGSATGFEPVGNQRTLGSLASRKQTSALQSGQSVQISEEADIRKPNVRGGGWEH